MMRFTLVGDLHGELTAKHLLNGLFGSQAVLQVGDLDIDPGYTRWTMQTDGIWRGFIDGNHEHFPSLQLDAPKPYMITPGLHHVPRAWVSGRTMFIGGANSIDAAFRTPGRSWWPEEGISQRQHMRAVSYDGQIDTVVAHTIPGRFNKMMLSPGCIPFNTPDGAALNDIYEHFKPKRWFCGHWHHSKDILTRDGCRIVALDIEETQLVDLDVNPEDFTVSS